MPKHDEIMQWTPQRRRTLAVVLDEVLPASGDGRMPAASGVGLTSYVEGVLAGASPEAMAILDGLATLDEIALARGCEDFAAFGSPERVEVLRAVPEGGWLSLLLVHAYGCYYQHPRVVEALGMDPTPPFPRGHVVPPSDPSLLDHVRRRGRMYRQI